MIYQAHIERAGPYVKDGLAENLLITFQANGPADCLDYALALQPVYCKENAHLLAGNWLLIGNGRYHITAAGGHAMNALAELGHLTLVFDGAIAPRHSGTVHLAGRLPALSALHGDFIITEEQP